MTSTICGRTVTGQPGAASPFEKIVAFGSDDGPTSGIVRCARCDDAYRFDTLATDVDGAYDHEAWDRGEELRIFSLARLPAAVFDQIVALLAAVESPRWPVWLPGVNTRTAELEQIIDGDVGELLATANHPELAVASPDLLESIVSSRDYPTESEPTASDWFALLGFAVDERLVAST